MTWNTEHLLSLSDALDDFEEGDYSLRTEVDVRIGSRTTRWELILEAPGYRNDEMVTIVAFQPIRDDTDDAETDEDSSFVAFWHVNLPEIAGAFGIDFNERIFQLEWAVKPEAVTTPRRHDPRWPNEVD